MIASLYIPLGWTSTTLIVNTSEITPELWLRQLTSDMEMTNQSKHKQMSGQAEEALGCASSERPAMKTRNKTQAHWPIDADRVANSLRQDLDVIPPKGEEQKSLNLRKKEQKK